MLNNVLTEKLFRRIHHFVCYVSSFSSIIQLDCIVTMDYGRNVSCYL